MFKNISVFQFKEFQNKWTIVSTNACFKNITMDGMHALIANAPKQYFSFAADRDNVPNLGPSVVHPRHLHHWFTVVVIVDGGRPQQTIFAVQTRVPYLQTPTANTTPILISIGTLEWLWFIQGNQGNQDNNNNNNGNNSNKKKRVDPAEAKRRANRAARFNN